MTFGFVLSTRAELLKCKNTAAIWLTLVGAAFIPAINVLKCVSRPDYFAPKMQSDPWGIWIDYNWQIAAAFFLMMYLILVANLVVQIEYRNNGWKQLYTTPRSYADIFLSKIIVIHFMVIGCFILFNIFIVASAFLTAMIRDQYTFFLHPVPVNEMLNISFKMYCSTWAVLAIQYWLGLRISNFSIPLGVGLVLFTAGFMIRQWEFIHYYPYMYPFLVYFENPGLPSTTAQSAMINSSLWMAIVLTLSFLDLSTAKEKG